MQVNRISSVNNYSMNGVNRNQNQVKKNDVQFTALVTQTAVDSYAPLVEKGIGRFMDYMKDLTMQAVNKNGGAMEQLKKLIGSTSAEALVKNPQAYTEALDKQATKLLPLSGQGTRGAEIRNKITNQLGIPNTNKTDVPLPAIIGKAADGEKIYLTTANNELLHMMEAGQLSPFEKIHTIRTEVSDGDATVLVEGLKKGIIPTDRPALFSYTDDVGTKGHEDYSELMKRFKELGSDSPVEVISRGYLEAKEKAAGVLGTFVPKGKFFAVEEKPKMELLNELIPNDNMVMTNIGKNLFPPKGLEEIKSRIPAGGVNDPANTLIKMDKGQPKWHVTEGILKPAGERGTLDVIPKGGNFSDIGNGAVFTDIMTDIASGKFPNVFPESLEAQIRKNVTMAQDGLSASLKYGDKSVELPTTFGDKLEKLKQEMTDTIAKAKESAQDFANRTTQG